MTEDATPYTPIPEINAAARWWANTIRDVKQDSGGRRVPVTEAQAAAFEGELAIALHAELMDGNEWRETDCKFGVDYGACSLLENAARAAGIHVDLFTFPLKTRTKVQHGRVTAYREYGVPETIYERTP